MKKSAFIDNWQELLDFNGDSYLIGEVSQHNRQDEFVSKIQQTSQVVKIDREKKVAETLNTIYTLGNEVGC